LPASKSPPHESPESCPQFSTSPRRNSNVVYQAF
jgi:hypothetical protein